MRYIIRQNPLVGSKGADAPTYWVPQHDGGYIRTGDIQQALARAFTTHAAALAYLQGHGGEGQNEVIELPDA